MKQSLSRDIEREKIAELAKRYENRGYRVYAEIRGYSKPELIGQFRPDLVAKKGQETIIVEVATRESAKRDKERLERLAEYAEEVPGVRFDLVMTSPLQESQKSARIRGLRKELRTIKNGLLADIRTALYLGNIELLGILCSRLLEGFLARKAEENSIPITPDEENLVQIVEKLAERKIISQEIVKIAHEFQGMRNMRMHGRRVIVSSQEAMDTCEKLISFLKQNDRTIDWELGTWESLVKRQLTLTTREMEILKLIAEGRTTTEIAKLLSISRNTVKNHLVNITMKLNVTRTSDSGELFKGMTERIRELAD